MNTANSGLSISTYESKNSAPILVNSLTNIKVACDNRIIESNLVNGKGVNVVSSRDSSSVKIMFSHIVDRSKGNRIIRERLFSCEEAFYKIECEYSFKISGYFVISDYIISKSENSLPLAEICMSSTGEIKYTNL